MPPPDWMFRGGHFAVRAHDVISGAQKRKTGSKPSGAGPVWKGEQGSGRMAFVSAEGKRERGRKADFATTWSECRDLNPGPLGPEPSAIPNFATPRKGTYHYKDAWAVCQALKREKAGPGRTGSREGRRGEREGRDGQLLQGSPAEQRQELARPLKIRGRQKRSLFFP